MRSTSSGTAKSGLPSRPWLPPDVAAALHHLVRAAARTGAIATTPAAQPPRRRPGSRLASVPVRAAEAARGSGGGRVVNGALRVESDDRLGVVILRVLGQRVIVSPQLRQALTTLPADPSPDRLDDVVTTVSQYVWACLGAQAIGVARELDLAAGELFTPREKVVVIDREERAVEARRAAGRLAAKLGFGATKRMKLMTAVSELSRNIVMYAGRGEVRLRPLLPPAAGVQVDAVDRGPGIADLEAVLGGTYRSRSGLGLGLRGVQTVADAFHVITSRDEGTHVQAVFHASRPSAARPEVLPGGRVR